jgi:hypothetical protein
MRHRCTPPHNFPFERRARNLDRPAIGKQRGAGLFIDLPCADGLFEMIARRLSARLDACRDFLSPHAKKRPQLGEAEAVVICCARQPRGGVDANSAQYTQHMPVSDDDPY